MNPHYSSFMLQIGHIKQVLSKNLQECVPTKMGGVTKKIDAFITATSV